MSRNVKILGAIGALVMVLLLGAAIVGGVVLRARGFFDGRPALASQVEDGKRAPYAFHGPRMDRRGAFAHGRFGHRGFGGRGFLLAGPFRLLGGLLQVGALMALGALIYHLFQRCSVAPATAVTASAPDSAPGPAGVQVVDIPPERSDE